jgi:hypothetical protein
MEQARLSASKLHETRDSSDLPDFPAPEQLRGPGSVVSLGSGLARSIVGSFNCATSTVDGQEQQLPRASSKSFASSPASTPGRRGRSRTQRNEIQQADV